MANRPVHGFYYSGQARHRLSYGQIKRLAQAFGLPGDAMAQIAKGESSMYADVQQRDPGDGNVGYGLLQMTPHAWGKNSAAYQYMQKLGGIRAMADPVKNMAMARFLYRSAGNKLTPWHGTRFLTNRSGEGTLGPVRKGAIPGLGGGGGGGQPGQVLSLGGGQQPDLSGNMAALQLLQQMTQQKQPAPVSSGLTAPAFSAKPALPGGFQQTLGAAGAPQKNQLDVGSMLSAIQQASAASAQQPIDGGGTTIGIPGVAGGGGGGAGGGSAAGLTSRKGVVNFAGKPVAAWIAPILQYARHHGWSGSVTSGYRSTAEQARIYNSGVRPAARPGTSNHEFKAFPGGAVDVSNAEQLAAILRRSPYAHLLVWAGAKDKVHFSHPHNGGY